MFMEDDELPGTDVADVRTRLREALETDKVRCRDPDIEHMKCCSSALFQLPSVQRPTSSGSSEYLQNNVENI